MVDYGFNLNRNQRKKKKHTRGLIIAFICFILILGSVSLLWFWRSLDYDFNNIFAKDGESTTAENTSAAPAEQSFSGKYTFLVAITSDDGKQAYIFNGITIDLSDKTIRAVPIDGDIVDSESGLNCYDMLVTSGIKSVVDFLGDYYDVSFNKYIVMTETDYKSVFRAMGDITVNIPEDVVYDTDNMFLEIPADTDVALSSDKVHKYMKYIYETKSGYERSEASAEIIVAAFNAFYNTKNIENAEDLFSKLINYCTTDISIVDFTEAKDEISYLLPSNSKEKLKVFVSDNIKADTMEGSGDA